MSLCNQFFCLASQQAILFSKNFNAKHYPQTVQPNSFIQLSIPMGMNDLCYFIPLLVA